MNTFQKPNEVHVQSDVLVIGGGAAGNMAALSARKQGVEVALVDKGGIYRSGCGAAGNDHFLAVLETGPEWDTKEAFLKWYHRLTQGLVNPKIIENGYLANIKFMVNYLEELGIPMRLDKKNNDYIRTQSFGQPGPYYINFDGRKLNPTIAAEAKKYGVKFFKHIAITALLQKNGEVVGAVGFNYRDGDFYVFRAKAVILATGNVSRLYDNPTGLSFNTWMSPFNTGTAQALAFQAGARLANMEFIGFTLVPKNFSAAGLNAFVGMGGYLVNALGERIAFKYHEQGEKGPRWALPWAVYWETKEGRGPCYFDFRHLPKEDLDHLKYNLLPVDKNTFLDYLEQAGIDLSKDLIEVQIIEGEIPAMCGQVSGIFVDEKLQTDLPGLFAAGGCALAVGSMSGSMCCGKKAGEEAALFASNVNKVQNIDKDVINQLKEDIYLPLKIKNGVGYQRFENKMRKIMSRYVGIGRTKKGLKTAEEELLRLSKYIPKLQARNGHELLRCQEAKHLIINAQLVVRGALTREESRFGLSHYRGDFPQSKDEWHKSILQKNKDGEVEISYIPAF
ncbi:MAG: FAD-dependent oxidoreductase [Thermoanaerobacter sp.]|nr:FAD-dependent oxidoreductase [Thermoanaerobacter sp.]